MESGWSGDRSDDLSRSFGGGALRHMNLCYAGSHRFKTVGTKKARSVVRSTIGDSDGSNLYAQVRASAKCVLETPLT